MVIQFAQVTHLAPEWRSDNTAVMALEKAQLRTRDGRQIDVEAEVKRYGGGARALRGGGTVLAFFIAGLLTIPVPGVHLVMPWFLPLLGMGIGAYIGRVSLSVGEVTGECPDCHMHMTIAKSGSVAEDEALWLRCPHCKVPLELMKTAAVPQ